MPKRCPNQVRIATEPFDVEPILTAMRQHFKTARQALGFTYAEVGQRLGVAKSTPRNFDAGLQGLPTGKLLHYAQVVHIPRSQILNPSWSLKLDHIVTMLEAANDPMFYDVLTPLIAHVLTYRSAPATHLSDISISLP